VPKELVIDRQIRSKKPWAIAGVAALLLGCTLNFMGYYWGWWSVHPKNDYEGAFTKVKALQTRSTTTKQAYKNRIEELKAVRKIGGNLVSMSDGRLDLNNLYLAIDAALPVEPHVGKESKWEVPIADRSELHIEKIDMQYFGKVGKHNEPLERWAREVAKFRDRIVGEPAAPVADADGGNDDEATPSAPAAGPKGNGWVVQITGYHYHNDQQELPKNRGAEFVKGTLLKNLLEGSVTVPTGDGDKTETKTMAELGISDPVLVGEVLPAKVERITNPNAEGTPQPETVSRFDFNLQFVWQPPSEKTQPAAGGEEGPGDADVVSRD
jgi:type IV pilus assembly protein PilM